MTGYRDDVSAAARALWRAPRFTAFAVGTLALGIGATAGAFTVVERVALRPLPYPGSERMALVGIKARSDDGAGPLSPALLTALQEQSGPLEAAVAVRARDAILQGDPDPERVRVTEVSSGFFPFFAARAALGRVLSADDHRRGAEPVVLLGHAVWQDRFGGDPAVVGRALRFDDRVRTVVGVLAPTFREPPVLVESGDYWAPLDVDPTQTSSFFLAGVARVPPGADIASVAPHMDAVVDAVYGTERPNFLTGGTAMSYQAAVVGPVSGALGRVFAAVALLMLIACVNVAGLLLMRGEQRRQELGMHAALGADRGRIVRKLLIESGLLALTAAAVGISLGWAATEFFRRYAPDGLPRLAEISLDGRGVVFALILAGAAAALAGLVPALRSTRGLSLPSGLGRGSTSSRAERRIHGGLVVLETALAVVMAVGAGLLAHDLARVAREDAGFRAPGLVALNLNLEPRVPREEWAATWERLLESAAALPGVTAAAVATQAPYDGSRIASTYRPEGTEDGIFAIQVGVGGDYVEALNAHLTEGRELTAADGNGEPVALVNEAFVRTYWPGESGVGKMVRSGQDDEPVYRVVGVIGDVSTRPGQSATPHVFLPLRRAAWRQMELLVRTEADAAELVPLLRAVVRRVDPGLPVTRVASMESLTARALAAPRFYATLFAGFATVALLLALVGVYGTTAYATRRRLRESGIRMALGARRGQVVGALVRGATITVGLGVVLGLLVAGVASAVLTDSLRYVAPRDPATYATVGATVLAVAALAGWMPASAAGRTDPVRTLRQE